MTIKERIYQIVYEFIEERFGEELRHTDHGEHLRHVVTDLIDHPWRPISEAPKDGTYVLLSFPGTFQDTESPGVAVGRYYEDGNYWWVSCIWGSGRSQKEPTHFAPLPTRAKH